MKLSLILVLGYHLNCIKKDVVLIGLYLLKLLCEDKKKKFDKNNDLVSFILKK